MKISFWDFLSGLLIIATIAVLLVVGIIFFNPNSSLNPFPYPTMPVLLSIPTSTSTPFILPPTWTPTPKITPTPNP